MFLLFLRSDYAPDILAFFRNKCLQFRNMLLMFLCSSLMFQFVFIAIGTVLVSVFSHHVYIKSTGFLERPQNQESIMLHKEKVKERKVLNIFWHFLIASNINSILYYLSNILKHRKILKSKFT